MTRHLRERGWVAGLLILVGINAVVAGYGFIADPDGSSVGIPLEWLEDSPFDSYLIPGIVLEAMGILALVSATMQLRRNEFAWAWAGVTGMGFVIWIVVQSIMMGSFRHPIQTTLQAVVSGIGIVVSSLAFLQYRDWKFGRGGE